MPAEMRSVYSSFVGEIGYDADAQELHVVYKKGKSAGVPTIYAGVSPELAGQIISAPSIGQALHGLIRVPKAAEPRFPHRYGDEGS